MNYSARARFKIAKITMYRPSQPTFLSTVARVRAITRRLMGPVTKIEYVRAEPETFSI